MKESIKLGVVCLARKTFDFNAALEIYNGLKEDLKKIENVEYTFVDNLVIEVEDVKEAIDKLLPQNIDGLVVISGTFHLGHLVLELDKVLKKPILLWGLNELPYNGGKIRLNSVCGVNLNASNLYKSGNTTYQAVFGNSIDEDWIDAIRVKKALSGARIGLIGYRAHGFFNLDIDELNTFKELSILINHYELSSVINREVPQEIIDEHEKNIRKIFDTSEVTDEQVTKVAKLAGSFEDFLKENNLNAAAVRCWPEFAASYGISPCAAMSYIQSKGYILGCEGDVDGVISMIAHRAVGAETPFLADLSQIDIENNFALLWHCGVAPCNLWDGKCKCSLDSYFAGGKGVTADFVMKSGDFSMLRFDSAHGKYRLFMEEGKAVYMEKQLKGTYMKAVFDSHIKDVMDRVVYNGVAHHASVVYGRYKRVFEIYAKLTSMEMV